MTLPVGWKLTTIGEVADINRRNPYLRELPDNLNVTFVPMAAVDAFSGMIAAPRIRSLGEVRKGFTPFSDGDVIFAKITPSMENGKAAVAKDLKNGLGFGSTEFHVISAKEGLLSTYIYYFIRQESFRRDAKANFAGTAGQLRVPSSFIGNYPFPLPPLTEQERIVARIEELFTQLEAGVAGLKRIQAALKRYKASVLKAACEGRLVPQDPNDEPAEELLRRLGKKPLEPNDMPELPEGWCWATVGDLARNIQYGYTESAREESVGPKFLRITDIQYGRVNWDSVPYCKISDQEIDKYILKPGDIVFARTGATTGKSYLITDCPKTVFASYLIRLRLPETIDAKYFALFLDSPIYWAQIMTVRKGSAQPGVNATILATLTVPLPPLTEQRRIVAEVERRLSVEAQVEVAVEAGLKRAGRLRQAVLKSAFGGKLTA